MEKERLGSAIETVVRDLVKGVLDNERQVNGSTIEIAGRCFAGFGLYNERQVKGSAIETKRKGKLEINWCNPPF
jgi:hypothetical protein